MSQLKVLVIGASIAGPTAAYWFAKAGARVTVIERFSSLRTSGQAVDIRNTGVTVIRRMPGVEASIRQKVVKIEGLSLVRADGTSYGTIKATGNPDQQSLLSEYEIFRGDLCRVLFDATQNGEEIEYVFNEQVRGLKQHESTVSVGFRNGTPSSQFDLVVACDGATSRTRAIGMDCDVRDYIKATNCWSTYFTVKHDLLQGSKVATAHSAVKGRFMDIGPDPSGAARVTLTKLNAANGKATIAFQEAAKKGQDSLKNYIAEEFEDAGWRSAELIKGMMETDDFYASEILMVQSPTLYQGRFVLVGDAGYAPGFTGTGTSLALTGAYVLAGEICKHGGDVKAGLEGYERVMRPIVQEMSKVPPLVPGAMSPQTATGISLRNAIFMAVARLNSLNIIQRIIGAAAFSNNKESKLPEYDWIK